MLFDDVKSKQPKVFRQWQERPDTVCPPEGETLREATDRLKAAIAKLTKKHKSGTIALVLSQPLASVLRCMLQAGEQPPTPLPVGLLGKPLWEPIELASAI